MRMEWCMPIKNNRNGRICFTIDQGFPTWGSQDIFWGPGNLWCRFKLNFISSMVSRYIYYISVSWDLFRMCPCRVATGTITLFIISHTWIWKGDRHRMGPGRWLPLGGATATNSSSVNNATYCKHSMNISLGNALPQRSNQHNTAGSQQAFDQEGIAVLHIHGTGSGRDDASSSPSQRLRL